MHRGYVKLWRKIQDNALWKERRKFSRAEAWIDIIMEAQHSPEVEQIIIGNTVVECRRGECVKSLETWSKRWNWTKSATRRFFNLLKNMGNIEIESVMVTTRIKVINYDTYCPLRNDDETGFFKKNKKTPKIDTATDTETEQISAKNTNTCETFRNANETQVKRKRNGSETEVTPDNNDKNVNNDKNKNNGHFDRFWNAYPKKVGKLAAFNSFKKIKNPSEMICVILDAIEKQKNTDQWKKDNGQFIPNPSTWLNQGRWEDEVETKKCGLRINYNEFK